MLQKSKLGNFLSTNNVKKNNNKKKKEQEAKIEFTITELGFPDQNDATIK